MGWRGVGWGGGGVCQWWKLSDGGGCGALFGSALHSGHVSERKRSLPGGLDLHTNEDVRDLPEEAGQRRRSGGGRRASSGGGVRTEAGRGSLTPAGAPDRTGRLTRELV